MINRKYLRTVKLLALQLQLKACKGFRIISCIKTGCTTCENHFNTLKAQLT